MSRNQPKDFSKNTKQGKNGKNEQKQKDKCGKLRAKYEQMGQNIESLGNAGKISAAEVNKRISAMQAKYKKALAAAGCK